MFYLIISRYVGPLAEVDLALAEHVAFLESQYRQGHFILSGPKDPRDGGLIVAKAPSLEALRIILEQDPFRLKGLIDYEVIGWNLNRRAPSLPQALFEGSSAATTINGASRLYFILGDPIAQVKSPAAFNQVFAERGMNAVFLPINVTPDGFDQFLQGISQAQNVDGMVMTVPHKFAGYRHCATASARAHFLQAVNVMRRTADGDWHGDMVDGLGYLAALNKAGCPVRGRSALLIGAGGAGSAIAEALVIAGVSRLAIHDQDAERRDRLVALLAGLNETPVAIGSRNPTGFDLVINATPMGMDLGDPYPVMVERLSPSTFVGDVITAPAISPLLERAKAIGCNTLTGGEMYDGVLELMTAFLL